MTGKFMKAIKTTLIVQAAVMYAMHLPLYLAMFLVFSPMTDGDGSVGNVIMFCLILTLVLECVATPICVVNTVFSIVSIFKGEYNPSKVTMIIKLSLIPWFVFNFIFCMYVFAGMLNPWLFIAVPLMLFLSISFTYMFMVTTSLPNVGYFIHCLSRKKMKIKPLLVFSIIMMFIFCLDAIGSIIFFIKTNKKESKS